MSWTGSRLELLVLITLPTFSAFAGRIVHSRWYREPKEYLGQVRLMPLFKSTDVPANTPTDYQHVLVVGAFASGSDIARELALLNLPTYDENALPTPASSRPQTPGKRTHVYQSSSGVRNPYNAPGEDAWRKFVELHGLIERIQGDLIIFKDGSELKGIDTIIFATGYEFYFPFFKVDDEPWSREEARLVTDVVGDAESVSPQLDHRGMRGLGMQHLDELMMFLQGDRSMAMLGLGESAACGGGLCRATPGTNDMNMDSLSSGTVPFIRDTIPSRRPPLVRAIA